MSISRRGFLDDRGHRRRAARPSSRARLSAKEGKGKSKAKSKAVLKLSAQIWIIPGKDLPERLATMQEWGFDGVELPGGDMSDRGLPSIIGHEKLYEDAVKNTSSKSARSAAARGPATPASSPKTLASGPAASRTSKNCSPRPARLHSTGVIYVPAFDGGTKLGNFEIRKILVEHAARHRRARPQGGHAPGPRAAQSRRGVFPSPGGRRRLDRPRLQNPGLGVMGDFYHMYIEETSDLGAFISGGSYVHHCHLASRIRVLPGQDERQFVLGFRGLKRIGYQDYCSFECGVRGDPKVEIPKSMAFLRDQWAKA